MVAISYPLNLAVRMRRYGSLININPSALKEVGKIKLAFFSFKIFWLQVGGSFGSVQGFKEKNKSAISKPKFGATWQNWIK